jgi:Tfp pilus assembly protein PilF
LLEEGKFAEAEADLNAVVRQKPDSPEVHFALARLHQVRGALRFQRQELAEALRLNPSLLPVRLELARALTRDGIPKTALDTLNELPAEQKNLPAVVEERNWALIAAGDGAAARQGIEQGLRGSRSGSLLVQDALLRLAQKDVDGARTSAAEALKANPGDVRALSILANSYVMQKQMPAAVQKVREYAAQATRFPAIQYYLGQMLAMNGNREEARAAFTAARAADSNFPDGEVALAQLDANDGKIDVARKRLTALLSQQGDVLSARLLMAQFDIQGRNYGSAAEYYRKLVAQYPNNLVVLNNLAYSLVETGQYDEALKYAQQAKEISPERADIDDTLGWVLYKKGIYTSAVQYLELAAARDGSALTSYHLGMAHLKGGNHKRGKELVQAALKAAPQLPEAKLAQAVLAEAGMENVQK